jgi:CheY-like chemotaxis protein
MSVSRILIVDDAPSNISILEAVLDEDIYELLSVESGEDAIAQAVNFNPGLVLLDVMMPGIDGYQVCEWFRAHHILKTAHIIMLSGKVMPADIERGLAAGADDYITKPFDLLALRNTIQALHESRFPS